MADMMTILEHFGRLEGLTLAYVGDGNNVARSLAYACAKFGLKYQIATPKGYALDEETIAWPNSIRPNTVHPTTVPAEAVKNADVVYTDTWVSMGQESEKEKRIADFQGFQVNAQLLAGAPAHVKVMHCLPAYRGFEITDEVAEADNCIIFDQAENRLHFQRGLLKKLLSK
jgi:ornithine carbamoyltransferase